MGFNNETAFALLFVVSVFSVTGCRSSHENKYKTDQVTERDKIVETFKELKAFTGKKAAKHIEGKSRQEAYLLNYKQLKINYGNNVEYQLPR